VRLRSLLLPLGSAERALQLMVRDQLHIKFATARSESARRNAAIIAIDRTSGQWSRQTQSR
jgi:hypothetical protein